MPRNRNDPTRIAALKRCGYGKSISTRIFSDAIHGNPAKRVRAVSSPATTSNDLESHSDPKPRDQPAAPDETEVSISTVQSKMAGFRHRDQEKPTIVVSTPEVNTRIGGKRKRSKRKAGQPLFLHGYNKRVRDNEDPTVRAPGGDRSGIMDRIRELFPVFRKGARESIVKPVSKDISASAPPSHGAPMQNQGHDVDPSLSQPQFRLPPVLPAEGSFPSEIQVVVSESFADIPFGSPPPGCSNNTPGPVQIAQDHFVRLIDDHFGKIRKRFNLPDVAAEVRAKLRRVIQEQDEKHQRKLISGQPKRYPIADSLFMESNKTVPEMVAMFRNGSTNSAQRGIHVPDYHQRPNPVETRILTLEGQGTTTREYRFDKEDLKGMRIIGQVDNKFIMAKTLLQSGKEAMIAFDQHAVHERVRLEILVKEYRRDLINSFMMGAPIKLVPIAPIEMYLTDDEFEVVTNHKKYFEHNGLNIEVQDKRIVLVRSAPVSYVEKVMREPREYKRNEKLHILIQTSIEQQVRYILRVYQIPSVTFDQLRSQACRTAIRFGDKLDRQQCQELIDQLAKCNSPFQCAHGRPVLTPVLDLTSRSTTPAYQAEITCFNVNK